MTTQQRKGPFGFEEIEIRGRTGSEWTVFIEFGYIQGFMDAIFKSGNKGAIAYFDQDFINDEWGHMSVAIIDSSVSRSVIESWRQQALKP